MTLIAALPFTGILLLLCWPVARPAGRQGPFDPAPLAASDFWNGKHWRSRLDRQLRHAAPREAVRFLEQSAYPRYRVSGSRLNEARRRIVGLNASTELQCVWWRSPGGTTGLLLRRRTAGSRPLPAFNPLAAAHAGIQSLRLYEAMTLFADGRAEI